LRCTLSQMANAFYSIRWDQDVFIGIT